MARLRVQIETGVDIDEKVDFDVDEIYDAMKEGERAEMYDLLAVDYDGRMINDSNEVANTLYDNMKAKVLSHIFKLADYDQLVFIENILKNKKNLNKFVDEIKITYKIPI